jgi:hypothetical protein
MAEGTALAMSDNIGLCVVVLLGFGLIVGFFEGVVVSIGRRLIEAHLVPQCERRLNSVTKLAAQVEAGLSNLERAVSREERRRSVGRVRIVRQPASRTVH